MAKIDKYGRVRGLVGNLVFRVVNGEEIMQSRPKRQKPSGKTLIENQQFADGVGLALALYVPLKNFAWMKSYSYFYGRLIAYMKRFLHGNLAQVKEGEYLAMDKNDGLGKLFKKRMPSVRREGNSVHVHIPELKVFGKDRQLAYSEYLSYEVVLMGFNKEGSIMSDIDYDYRFETDVFHRGEGYKEETIEWDLEQIIDPNVNLLIAAMRVKLFEYPNASEPSNSKEANPVGILGVWSL